MASGKMAGKRLAQKAVDWARLGQNIPAAATAQFNAFRNRHETIKGSLSNTAEKPTPIDWTHYSSVVKNKDLVQKLQAAYGQVKVPTQKIQNLPILRQRKKRSKLKLQ